MEAFCWGALSDVTGLPVAKQASSARWNNAMVGSTRDHVFAAHPGGLRCAWVAEAKGLVTFVGTPIGISTSYALPALLRGKA